MGLQFNKDNGQMSTKNPAKDNRAHHIVPKKGSPGGSYTDGTRLSLTHPKRFEIQGAKQKPFNGCPNYLVLSYIVGGECFLVQAKNCKHSSGHQ
jgi:hypothetical protein